MRHNFSIGPVMYLAVSFLAMLYKFIHYSIVEEGWLAAGIAGKSPFSKIDFDNFLNAARTADIIVMSIVYGITFILGALTFIGLPFLNIIFAGWAEILFFAVMFLPMAPAGLMTYSFYNESSLTSHRMIEAVFNFIFWMGMMGVSLVFLPEVRIWYSKAQATCSWDSLFEGDEELSFGSVIRGDF